MSRLLFRAALRLVPLDWRDAVERDLQDDDRAGAWTLAIRAAAIAGRLHAARARDRITTPKTWRLPFMREFTRDLELAVRSAFRRPGFALAVVATLAIGIGANTAIYSVFNWILFRPTPGVEQPDELVTVRFLRPASQGRFFVSYRDVADLRDGVPALSGLAASASQSMNVVLNAGADPERIEGEIVTFNYFDVLGVHLQSGRGFLRGEDQPGPAAPPAVISDALRRRAFGAVNEVLGRQLTINGHPFTIVGVAPRAFRGRTLVASSDLWVPTGAHMQIMASSGPHLLTDRRVTLFIDAVGRLRPGTTLAQAQAQARAVAAAIPDYGGRRPGARGGGIYPALTAGLGLDEFATERLATMWRLLAAAVGLVLLLACANAANLLLARALGRRREIAVCQAIGASRFRLIRQQMAEGLVLAVAAGGAGLLIALALTWAFDGMRIVNYLPEIDGVGLDRRVGAFALVLAVTTGLLFSLAPALASSRVDLQSSLKDGLTSSRRGSGRLRAALVAVQVAIGTLLLIGAGLFARTLHNVRALDLGVTLDGVVTLAADPTKLGYDDAAAHRYFQSLLERLRATPGVEGAAFVWSPPYSNIQSDTSFRREGADQKESDAETTSISPGYFATLGVPILSGRDFMDSDYRETRDATADVAIVSERLAREVFPQGGAVGSRIVLSYPKGKVIEIVGVAGNVRRRPVTRVPEPFIYMPGIKVWGSVVVRSSLPFAQTATAIRSVARELDGSLPPYDLEPMAAGLDRVISEQRLLARFSGIFAVVAALLAAVGVYGMMACAVGERMREFGIRLALGAREGVLLRTVLAGAARVTCLGLVFGVLASVAATRGLESRLYGIARYDAGNFLLASAVLLTVAMAASLVPAFRASRADPVRALRVD